MSGYDIVNAIRFCRDPSDTLAISNCELVSEADVVLLCFVVSSLAVKHEARNTQLFCFYFIFS